MLAKVNSVNTNNFSSTITTKDPNGMDLAVGVEHRLAGIDLAGGITHSTADDVGLGGFVQVSKAF